jgi:Ni,Fe-hydrogenase III large subunit
MQRIEMHSHEHKVSQVDVNWGFENRPLWHILTQLSPNAIVKWVDRYSPMEAIACEWAVANAYESALKISVPSRVQNMRAIYLEIQRVLWCVHYFSGVFRAIEDDIRFQEALRLREMVFEIQETLTGNRVLPQVIKIGGLERDLSLGESKKLRATIHQLHDTFKYFFGELTDDPLIARRLAGVLTIPLEKAWKISLRGPLGQASGVLQDSRVKDPIGIYTQYGIHYFDGPQRGDALSRLRSVQFQVGQSLKLLALFLSSVPEGTHQTTFDGELKLPQTALWSVVEAGPGPLYAFVRGKEIRLCGHSARLKGTFERLLIGLDSDDFELGLASMGMDFSQADLE